MSSLFLCFLKASRETLPMNALIVYIIVENIKTGICVASDFELSRCSRNMLFDGESISPSRYDMHFVM